MKRVKGMRQVVFAAAGLVCILALMRLGVAQNANPVQAALEKWEAGKGSAAISILEKALQATPGNIEARKILANFYFSKNKFRKAEKIISRSCAFVPRPERFTTTSAFFT